MMTRTLALLALLPSVALAAPAIGTTGTRASSTTAVKPTITIADDALVSTGNNFVHALVAPGFAADLSWEGGDDSFHQSESWSEDYGNDRFGAEIEVSSSVAAGHINIAAADYLSSSAELEATATLFGRTRTVALARGEAVRSAAGENGSTGAFTLTVQVMGSDIAVPSYGANSSDTNAWNRTFFSKSETFMLGPIPLTVEGSVDGTIGVTHDADAPVSSFSLDTTVEPFCELDADVALGVGITGVVAAGVSGHLNVLDVSVPTTASIEQAIYTAQGRTLDWSLDSDVDVTTLSGSISLWVELLWERYSRRIANWSGNHNVFGLFYDDGRACLGTACLGM
jgi:hypothetical protein